MKISELARHAVENIHARDLSELDYDKMRERDECIVQAAMNAYANEAGKPLAEALHGLISEAEYSASSGLPFNALGGTWTQLAKAKACYEAHCREHGPEEAG